MPAPEPLISIDAARRIVASAVRPLASEPVAVDGALGRTLAEDVTAGHDVPPFASSAMDGFAVTSGPAGRQLAVAGESRAGAPAAGALAPEAAIRISTGAVVPAGADAVLQLELVSEAPDGTVTLERDVRPGENVRQPGEDMRAGAVVLGAGTTLGPAELGVAVNAGRAMLRCARRPRVALVCTGDELVAPGAPLRPGQIHNSNAVTLTSLARRSGAVVAAAAAQVGDDRDATSNALGAALSDADVVVISGGVSVGPHDHVKPALEQLGVEQRFWRVALKPGKPTWFGTRAETLVFGLPGNPVSSMVTFLLFVRPALAALQGAPADAGTRTARLGAAVARAAGRDEALRVRLEDAGGELRALPTGPQGSHVLTSMLGADGLAIVPAGEGELAAGEPVAVELI